MNFFFVFTISVSFIGFIFDSVSLFPICWMLLFICLVSYFKAKAARSNIGKNWLNPSYLLLLGILIVCLQTIINVSINLAPFSTYLSAKYQPYLRDVTYVGFIAIVSYLLGNSLLIKPIQIKTITRKEYVLWPWLILLVAFFVLFVGQIDMGSFLTGYAYVSSGSYDRSMSSSAYYEQLLDVTLVIITSIITYRNLCENDSIKLKSFLSSFPITFWIIIILYIVLRLLSGDRGPVMYSICLVFYSYAMCSKTKYRFLTVAFIVFAAAMVITLLGVARGGDLDKSFIERLENAATLSGNGKPSVFPSTQELANSVNTEFIAIKAVNEEQVDYTYGKYTFYALIGSIPGSSYVLTNIFDVNIRDTMSSEFLTKYHLGSQYGYGLGTSPMAEFYLEIGILGVCFGFIFLGWLFNHLDYAVSNANFRVPLWYIIITLKLSSVAIYIPRSSVSSCISKAIYTLIIFIFFNYIFQFFNKRSPETIRIK